MTTQHTITSRWLAQKKSRHGGIERPHLRLTGKILEAIGLKIGQRVHITVENERLIISPANG